MATATLSSNFASMSQTQDDGLPPTWPKPNYRRSSLIESDVTGEVTCVEIAVFEDSRGPSPDDDSDNRGWQRVGDHGDFVVYGRTTN